MLKLHAPSACPAPAHRASPPALPHLPCRAPRRRPSPVLPSSRRVSRTLRARHREFGSARADFGKHALTALQDKGRIRVAEDAAQQPVEVEAGDGAVGVSSGDFLAASLTAISSAAGVLCLMIGLSGRMRRGLLREARAGPLAVCFRRARRAGCQASRSR